MEKMDKQQTKDGVVQVVILANQPHNLRHMLHRALAATLHTLVIIDLNDPDMISQVLARVPADWVIASLTAAGKLAPPMEQAIEAYPSLAAIGISADGDRIAIYGRRSADDSDPQPLGSLDELSLSDLIHILEDDER